MPFDSPTDLRFSITGYTANGYLLFSEDAVVTVSGVTSANVPNIAIAYHEEFSAPASATALTLDVWTDGTIESGQVDWYQFTADGSVYSVRWNDSFRGDNTKTAYILGKRVYQRGRPALSLHSRLGYARDYFGTNRNHISEG